MKTLKTCDGFHGVSRITIDESRVIQIDANEWQAGGPAAWLSPAEMAANKPCSIRECTCCDGFTILEIRDGGYGDCLVVLRD